MVINEYFHMKWFSIFYPKPQDGQISTMLTWHPAHNVNDMIVTLGLVTSQIMSM